VARPDPDDDDADLRSGCWWAMLLCAYFGLILLLLWIAYR
jgi:hypothetical protein